MLWNNDAESLVSVVWRKDEIGTVRLLLEEGFLLGRTGSVGGFRGDFCYRDKGWKTYEFAGSRSGGREGGWIRR